MCKEFRLLISFLLCSSFLFGQHDLQQGPYQFQYWDANSLAGTYPDHMMFYFLATTSDPTVQDDFADAYNLAYNLTNSSRIRGLGADGFSMLNTAQSQHHPSGYQLGATVLKLNTLDRYDITLDWTAKTIQSGGRMYALQLFYRVGSQGVWTAAVDLNNDEIIYQAEATNGSETALPTWTFPTVLEDEAEIELMWKYFEDPSSSQQGGRSQLAIKFIEVNSQGINDPEFEWITQNEYTIQQFNNEAIDSVLLVGENWNAPINIEVNAPFEISFSENSGFNNTIQYVSTQPEEDSVMVYIQNVNPETGWTSAVIEATSIAQVATYEHPWYRTQAVLPDPLILADEHLFFTEWSPYATAGSFPEHMTFQMAAGDDYPSLFMPLPYDWQCKYNLTARSRFEGQGDWGIVFRNTSSPQWDNCNGQGEDLNQFVGAVTLLANTENVDSAVLAYYIMMFEQADVEEKRKYVVELQYRLSPVDTFTSFSDSTWHPAFDVLNYDEQFMHIRLPESLLGQDFLQFRWLYFDLDSSFGTGVRPTYRLDEVSLVNLALPIEDEEDDISINEKKSHFSTMIYPNPVQKGDVLYFKKPWSGIIYDMQGKEIQRLYQVENFELKGIPSGIYFLRNMEEGSCQKIIIQ